MSEQRTAVIVEDDLDIRELISTVLSSSGFTVHTASSGMEGVAAIKRHNPDVVTLDLGLPDIDGFEVARQVRRFSDTYIIMLTARAEELDTLLGLETGADDYLTKPFRPRELRARITAMLRRPRATKDNDGGAAVGASTPSGGVAVTTDAPVPEPVLQGAGVGGGGQAGLQLSPSGGAAVPAVAGGGTALAVAAEAGVEPSLAAPVPAADGVLEHNGIVVDNRARTVIRSGRELDLTRSEFDLLYALMESGRVVRTKADLVRRLRNEPYNTGGYISDSDERTIEVHMANLRRKLGDDTKAPRWIKTVRGVGYSLAPKR
ncbi:response regulator transcription factor [Arthrobacter sulfonylureivorans]|uniref:Response regulator transcription factor n=1 Tax=Arthrobacter sulfonylureivorans TaxID=2486855 RepID=A0ABY3W8P0_9MICC|nr:response regulator [Arthrobacter sulfonylureivorans]UNK44933.1 response regulator transcription factor [Arthrobacter sulfonylureivorans]